MLQSSIVLFNYIRLDSNTRDSVICSRKKKNFHFSSMEQFSSVLHAADTVKSESTGEGFQRKLFYCYYVR